MAGLREASAAGLVRAPGTGTGTTNFVDISKEEEKKRERKEVEG